MSYSRGRCDCQYQNPGENEVYAWIGVIVGGLFGFGQIGLAIFIYIMHMLELRR
jgi:hypothetical protein